MEGSPHRTASYTTQCAACDEPATHACVLCERPACEAHYAGDRACWDCLGRYGRRLIRVFAFAGLAVVQPALAMLHVMAGCWHVLVGVGVVQLAVYATIADGLSRRRFARIFPRGREMTGAALRAALSRTLAMEQVPGGCGQCARQPRALVVVIVLPAAVVVAHMMVGVAGAQVTAPIGHGAAAAAFAALGVAGFALLLRAIERHELRCPHRRHEVVQVPRRAR